MNEEQPEVTEATLEDIFNGIKKVEKAINNLDDSTTALQDNLNHLSGQIDILNHSLYVGNEYLSWITISIMLVAALLMFLVGYLLTRR